jgi:hypothetical protein
MKHARSDYERFQDPHGEVPEDEPVFLIRGQDKAGAHAVRAWAHYNMLVGGSAEMSQRAMAHADLMDAWPKKKVADRPIEASELAPRTCPRCGHPLATCHCDVHHKDCPSLRQEGNCTCLDPVRD